MIKENLDSLILDLKTQYVPNGHVEFFNVDTISENHILNDFPMYKITETIYMESADAYHLVEKVTNNFILQITCSKSKSNLGILKASLKKISEKVFSLLDERKQSEELNSSKPISDKINSKEQAIHAYCSKLIKNDLISLTIDYSNEKFFFLFKNQEDFKYVFGEKADYARIQAKVRNGSEGKAIEITSLKTEVNNSDEKTEEKSDYIEVIRKTVPELSNTKYSDISSSMEEDIEEAETADKIASEIKRTRENEEIEIQEFRKRLVTVLDKAKKAFDNVSR